MMRKGIMFVTALVLICVFAFPSAAQTVAVPGSADNAVYAKYTSAPGGCYTGKASGGSASVTTDGGIILTIKGVPDDLTLVVMPVLDSDTQAWSWFCGMMDDRTERFMPFDIYFKDESGNMLTAGFDIEVTISVPEDYTGPELYQLFSDETINKLNFSDESEALSFTYSGSGYIVLAQAMSGGKPNDNPDSRPDGKEESEPDTTDTGDNSNITVWLWVCGVSLLGLSLLIIAGRKKRRCAADAVPDKGI